MTEPMAVVSLAECTWFMANSALVPVLVLLLPVLLVPALIRKCTLTPVFPRIVIGVRIPPQLEHIPQHGAHRINIEALLPFMDSDFIQDLTTF